MRIFYIALLFLLAGQSVSFAQTVLIRGRIKDNRESAVPFASVSVKGKKGSSVSGPDGEFSISVRKLPVRLIFSSVGYETKELEVKEKDSLKEISVSLIPVTRSLEEVVVVGYGASEKRDVVGSVSSSSDAAPKMPLRGRAISRDTTGNEAHGAGKPGNARILTAAELSDFKKWALWEGYTKEEFKEWSEHWGISPTERYCVQVQNEDHKGITGEKVFLIDENTRDTAWRAVTDNTGKAELWANFDKTANRQDNYGIVCGSQITLHPVTFENGINYFSFKRQCSQSNIADIAFVVDATGSMGDEIKYLQAELQDVIGGLSAKNKGIDLNLGAVFYRDHGDEFLTRHQDFGRNLPALTQFIRQQSAGGGGDYPEAVDAALTTALDSLHWDAEARTKILFLILDAPPHDEAKDRVKTLVIRAASMGIRIVPIVCSGTDKSTEYVMRAIALATNGSYVFLTDDSGVGDKHIKPTTDNYKVELLNDLLQRVISEMVFMLPCATDEVTAQPVNSNDNVAKVVVYPNPTRGMIGIKTSEKIKELFVADFTGKVLQKITVNSKSENWQADLGKYPSGTYVIEYFTEDKGWGAEKVVLMK